jgi:hypothetical protein
VDFIRNEKIYNITYMKVSFAPSAFLPPIAASQIADTTDMVYCGFFSDENVTVHITTLKS